MGCIFFAFLVTVHGKGEKVAGQPLFPLLGALFVLYIIETYLSYAGLMLV